MAIEQDIDRWAAALCDLLAQKFGTRARDLRGALRQAGRRLPRAIRVQGQQLVQAEAQLGHPRLAMQLDRAALETAFEQIAAHLRAIDVGARRRLMLLRLAGRIGFYLLAIFAAYVLWLWWRGFV